MEPCCAEIHLAERGRHDESVYEAAEANMRSADAQMRMAQKAITDAEIRAPFPGIVAKKIVNAGEKVGVDSPLFQLVDLGIMEIEAPAPASEVPAVRVGQVVTFRVDGFGDRTFDGRVERINPMTEQGSRSITLYISVANRDGVLRGGMFARGRSPSKSARPEVVPATAIRDEAGAHVFTIRTARPQAREGRRAGRRPGSSGEKGLESGLWS
jgi:RND family efflux transporter MFP subunit